MKKIIFTIWMLFQFASLHSQTNQQAKTKVLILGVFHFVSNNDGVKFEKENMLSPERQEQVAQLNKSLALFKPDKIFVEWKPKKQGYVDSSYAEYLKGTLALSELPAYANEVYQVGYKLGKMLGHKKVYCMDAEGAYLYDTVARTAKKFGQYEQLADFYNREHAQTLKDDSIGKTMTLKNYLAYINQSNKILTSHWMNAGITTAAYIGEPGEYAGAEFIGEWYKRNVRMFSNIVRRSEKSDKAILIIVGAGHARIIQHFFEDSPLFEVVQAQVYLK
jgi:hypothetical protein